MSYNFLPYAQEFEEWRRPASAWPCPPTLGNALRSARTLAEAYAADGHVPSYPERAWRVDGMEFRVSRFVRGHRRIRRDPDTAEVRGG